MSRNVQRFIQGFSTGRSTHMEHAEICGMLWCVEVHGLLHPRILHEGMVTNGTCYAFVGFRDANRLGFFMKHLGNRGVSCHWQKTPTDPGRFLQRFSRPKPGIGHFDRNGTPLGSMDGWHIIEFQVDYFVRSVEFNIIHLMRPTAWLTCVTLLL